MCISKQCIFCKIDLSGNRAKEHIFSRDLLLRFGVEKSSIEHCSWQSQVETGFWGGLISKSETERKPVLNSFLAGRVCNTCNNGWMNSLEIICRPILYPLMEGKSSIRNLSEEDKTILGKWLYKTVVVLWDSVGNNGISIPQSHVETFYQKREVPQDCAMFISSSNRFEQTVNWALSPAWVVEKSMEMFNPNQQRDAYKVYIQLGQVEFLTVFWPHQHRLYTYDQKLVHPLISNNLAIPVERSGVREAFGEFKGSTTIMSIGVLLGDLQNIKKVGRNHMCPCASRLKYKFCHGK